MMSTHSHAQTPPAKAGTQTTGQTSAKPLPPSKRKAAPAFVTLGALAFIGGIIWVAIALLGPKSPKNDKISTDNSKIVAMPETYTEYYTLKKGDSVRVKVPPCYDYEYSGGGAQYIYHPQNQKRDTIGVSVSSYLRSNENTGYFDLLYYNKEVTISVDFKKVDGCPIPEIHSI